MKVWILGLVFWLQVSAPLMARQALQFSCQSKSSVTLDGGQEVRATVSGKLEDIGFSQTVLSHRTVVQLCDDAETCQVHTELVQNGVLKSTDYRPILYNDHVSFSLVASPATDPKRIRLLVPEKVAKELIQEFSAVLVTSDWKQIGGLSLPLPCKADIVTSQASDEMKSAEDELKRAQAVVRQQFGLSKLSLKVSARALQEQVKDGQDCVEARCVSFSQATQIALGLIFESQDHAEAPLEIALSEVPREPGAWYNSEARKSAARKLLRDELDRSQSKFALFTGYEDPEIAFPPEQNENPARNWIFSIYIPSLSDHFYWVVIDKEAKKKPYIYGFN